MLMRPGTAVLLFALIAASAASAAVLPDDRADALYHRYDGGGVTIDGPSLLVRKKFAERYSVAANYYVDMVSSASIDVVTQASPYREERTQWSLGFDMLNGKTQYSLGFVSSTENDYDATTASFDLSQDMFGDLTTVSFGVSRSWDDVRRRGDPGFDQPVDRWSYRVGLSQIVTPQLMANFAFETITDEGFLNNPYRSVRYLDSATASGYAWQPELYPATRTSNAASLGASYYLKYRAALHGEYRYFSDTWGVDANTVRLAYTHPWGDRWIFEAAYRWYDQSAADFYADLFPRANAQNFLGRDKELSTFTSHMFSVGATWQLPAMRWAFVQRSTVNLFYDHALYDYADFRDVQQGGAPGTEPLYHFSADVLRVFVSVWF
jgi:hypothetical protein